MFAQGPLGLSANMDHQANIPSNEHVVGTHWNCLIEAIPMCTYNICPFNK